MFWILWEKQNFLLNLVEDPAIWGQGKKDSLSRDKQYDQTVFVKNIFFIENLWAAASVQQNYGYN